MKRAPALASRALPGLLPLLGLLGAACGSAPENDPKATVFALVGGAVDEADPAVVGLAIGGRVYCTGTLISSRVVATAAHCVGDGMPESVYFGSKPHLDGTYVDVEQRRIHPRYVASRADREPQNDVAALLLVADAPNGTTPLTLATPEAPPTIPVGAGEVRAVGFGMRTDLNSVVGFKSEGFLQVDRVEASAFYTSVTAGPHPCNGDSGGPALIRRDGAEVVVGIASGGDAGCGEYGRYTRVEGFVDEFFRHFPDPTARAGERCFHDDNCTTALCLPREVDGFAYCSSACGTAADCPASMRCVMDAAGDRRCRFQGPAPGALGTACEKDRDCETSVCRPAAGGTGASVCTLRCFPENEIACPPGYTCTAGTGDQSFCFDRTEDAPPPGEPPNSPEGADQSGCRFGSKRAPAGGTEAVALLGLVLAGWVQRRAASSSRSISCAPVAAIVRRALSTKPWPASPPRRMPR